MLYALVSQIQLNSSQAQHSCHRLIKLTRSGGLDTCQGADIGLAGVQLPGSIQNARQCAAAETNVRVRAYKV